MLAEGASRPGVTLRRGQEMKCYLVEPGSRPTAQGQAAYVESKPSAAMLDEVSEAVKDARLVGWDLGQVPHLDFGDLEQIDQLARRWNTLVVVIKAPPEITHALSTRPLSNIVLG